MILMDMSRRTARSRVGQTIKKPPGNIELQLLVLSMIHVTITFDTLFHGNLLLSLARWTSQGLLIAFRSFRSYVHSL